MRVSLERLLETADATGFRPEMLVKAIQLLHLLQSIQEHPDLKGKLALKGGTALNLFYFDVPRLSVDIDLNYVGKAEREAMLADRPLVESAIQAVCSREGFAVTRVPDEHAGGKWRLRYESAYGQGANLELDVNYMYRIPLWPLVSMDSNSLGPAGEPLRRIFSGLTSTREAMLSLQWRCPPSLLSLPGRATLPSHSGYTTAPERGRQLIMRPPGPDRFPVQRNTQKEPHTRVR